MAGTDLVAASARASHPPFDARRDRKGRGESCRVILLGDAVWDWRVPIPDDLLDALMPPGAIPDDIRRNYLARLRDHPAATFIDPVTIASDVEGLRRAFVRCTAADFGEEVGGDPIAPWIGRRV